MERLELEFDQLKRALKTLEDSLDVLKYAKTLGHVGLILAAEDSIIQRFEYTAESFWKFLKKYLEAIHYLVDINSSRKALYAGVKYEICTPDEGAIFLDMVDDRNETSHTYSIEESRIILSDIPRYYFVMVTVSERLARTLNTL
jgi:nucleotidyltransferase substrate binding protein (TIGR01987 family)